MGNFFAIKDIKANATNNNPLIICYVERFLHANNANKFANINYDKKT